MTNDIQDTMPDDKELSEILDCVFCDGTGKVYNIRTDKYELCLCVEAKQALLAWRERYAEAEKKSKDNAYWERNQLVAYLASQYEAHMVRHPNSDKTWEDDWRWIICIHTPTGQMTWHIHDSDVPTFGFLIVEPDGGHWDGHTTEEKYKRLAQLKKEKQSDE